MKETTEKIFKRIYKLEYKVKGIYGDDIIISEPKVLKELQEDIKKLKTKSDKYHGFEIYEVVTEGTKTTKLYKKE